MLWRMLSDVFTCLERIGRSVPSLIIGVISLGALSSLPPPVLWGWNSLGQKSCRTKSSPNFSDFRPELCPEFCFEFSPNFLRSFRASFRGKRRPEKIHQKSPPFLNVKFPGRFEEKIHKSLLESGRCKTQHFLDPKHHLFLSSTHTRICVMP